MLSACPSSPRAAPSDPILELYRASGAEEQLGQYAKIYESFLSQQSEDTPPKLLKAMQAALRETKDSISLDTLFLARLRSGLNETTARAVLRFLESPAGRTVTEAERRAQTPEGMTALQRYMKEEGPAESDLARIELLRVLDAATGASEFAANQKLAIQYAMAMAFDAAKPEAERRGSDVVWALVQQGEAQAKLEAVNETRIFFLFSYRVVSKAELREYIAFAVSEPGLLYHRVLSDAMLQTLLRRSRQMAAVIAREMMPK